MPSSTATPHRLVVTLLTHDGTRSAAAATDALLHSFPSVRCVLMCGIAGGVPATRDVVPGVQLGDIVSTTDGLVDVGHVRTVDGVDRLRRAADPPSRDLVRADRSLEAREHLGQRPWERSLNDALAALPGLFARPGGPGMPQVHRGAIGSSDRLVRDAGLRDRWARDHGIIAVDMEAVGVATAAAQRGIPWFSVRGISDFSDGTKNDAWHGYASVAASAYLRALLRECAPFPATEATIPASERRTSAPSRVQVMVQALMAIPEVADQDGRRELLAQLPRTIAGAVPYHSRTRLHLTAIVQTCMVHTRGRAAFLDALHVIVPDSSLALRQAEVLIDLHWQAGDST